MVRKPASFSAVLAAVAFSAVLFGAGVAVGHYEVFPYNLLKDAKTLLISTETETEARSEQPAWPEKSRYMVRRRILELYEAPADIVMVGDSLTDTVEWSELFPGTSIANRGITGDTTSKVLYRLDTVVSTGAKDAFILVGINDFLGGANVETVYQNYLMILDALMAQGVRPHIQSTIYVGESRRQINEKVRDLNRRLHGVASERGLTYVDLNAVLAVDGVLNPLYTTDDIHLNADGYAHWRDTLKPLIARAGLAAAPNANDGPAGR
jgi:lysophospholipase L1-like esterase